MRILVSGAGPAGLAAGYWLERNGHDVTIVERHDGLRLDGYGLDFFGTGYDVAERMGIVDELQRKRLAAEFLGFVDTDGKETGRVHIEALTEALGGRYVPIMHYTLEQTLYDALPESVEVRFGDHITGVTQDAAGVDVSFDKGSTERFELVVGAEGIHSHLRELVFGPFEDFARYLGFFVACFLFDNDLGLDPGWINLAGIHNSIGAYPTDREGTFASLFIWERPDAAHVPHAERRQVIVDEFTGAGWISDALLERIPPANDLFFDSVTQIVMPSWSEGRVVLIGDAAYCLTLLSGQGSQMALAGAYVLAEELGATDDLSDALANYENRLRPHMELRQRKAHDLVKSFVPGSKAMQTAENVAFKVLLRDAMAGTIAKYLYMSGSLIRERMLHRLPESHGNVLGYRLSGKLDAEDIGMIRLDVERALRRSDDVRMLLLLDDFDWVTRHGLVADLKFGKEYRDRISRLAVVGDGPAASFLATSARPFNQWIVEHFESSDLDAAWSWIADDGGEGAGST